MHRIAKIGLLSATAFVLSLPASVALADAGCWYHINNRSVQTWHYEILLDDNTTLESGSIPPGLDTNYDYWQGAMADGWEDSLSTSTVEYVNVWVYPPAATGNTDADFYGSFYFKLMEPEDCLAVMSGTVVDESGRTRVTIRGGQLELLD